MHSALYYPFTGPGHGSFLKTALFLWDSVDFIVPYRGFRLHGETPEEDEALEIVGRNYVPTDEDKRNVHNELEDLCTGPLSDKLDFQLERPELAFSIYPAKLLAKTWEMLAESRLANVVSGPEGISNASTHPLFGYYMMSILAVCCAQGQKPLVTDQHDPYRTLANILVDTPLPDRDAAEGWHGRLIALSLSGPDFDTTPLQKLIDIRTHENALLLDTRRAFLRALDDTAAEISKNLDNINIVAELIRNFTDGLEKDSKELKRALRRSAASLFLSKEFLITVLAFTTLVPAEPFSGTAVTIGGLAKGLIDYQDRRHKILREHPSSWLLATCGPRFPAY